MKSREKARVAIVHDWVASVSGGEKCVEAIVRVLSQHGVTPDFFSLTWNEKGYGVNDSILSKLNRKTSFLQRFPGARTHYRYFLPLMPLAIETLDLSGYDIIISNSSCISHGVITNKNQKHISYISTPMRYIWSGHGEYLSNGRSINGLVRPVWGLLSQYLRMWDFAAGQRADEVYSISETVSKRVQKYWNRESLVIYPPVKFLPHKAPTKNDYYVVASRLIPYKRLDLIVKTFISELKDKNLIVLGDGSEAGYLKQLAGSAGNIKFMGYVDDVQKAKIMSEALGFVYCADEDFGIVMAESISCGTGVIARNIGGATEIVNNGQTGVLYDGCTESEIIRGLTSGVREFERLGLHKQIGNTDYLQKFSVDSFEKKWFEVLHQHSVAN